MGEVPLYRGRMTSLGAPAQTQPRWVCRNGGGGGIDKRLAVFAQSGACQKREEENTRNLIRTSIQVEYDFGETLDPKL